MKFIAFHGSPGTPADFTVLKSFLPARTLFAPARPGYENWVKGDDVSSLDAKTVALGYSWGAVEALRFAAKERASAVLLVSAYLFRASNPSDGVKNLLLKMPGLGNCLIGKAAEKAVDELLVKSSAPDQVPDSYRTSAEAYRAIPLLKQAVLEKTTTSEQILSLIDELARRNIPIGVIHGEADQTSSIKEQIAPLRSRIKLQFEEIIPHAGHALLWTRTQKLAEIIRGRYL